MEQWIIDKKVFIESKLSIEEFLILYLIYNKQFIDLIDLLSTKYKFTVYYELDVVKELQLNNYIRIVSDCIESIVLTEKTNKLFEQDSMSNSIKQIIDVLNKHSNSKYRANSQSTIKFLNARLKNYTKEEIIETTKFMCKKWKGSMEEYLRPETLYNETKFQSYFNEWFRSNNKNKNSFTDLV